MARRATGRLVTATVFAAPALLGAAAPGTATEPSINGAITTWRTVVAPSVENEVGSGTLLLALVLGLVGFALLLLLLLIVSRRGRQLLLVLGALRAAGLGRLRERGGDAAPQQAEMRRRWADAVQDLRAVLGEGRSAVEIAHEAALLENALWEDTRTRARAREVRLHAREKAAARVAVSRRRAEELAAVQRAVRELILLPVADQASVQQTHGGDSDSESRGETDDRRVAAAMQAATASWLAAQTLAAETLAAETLAAETLAADAAASTQERNAAERAAAEGSEAARADDTREAEPAAAAAAQQAAEPAEPKVESPRRTPGIDLRPAEAAPAGERRQNAHQPVRAPTGRSLALNAAESRPRMSTSRLPEIARSEEPPPDESSTGQPPSGQPPSDKSLTVELLSDEPLSDEPLTDELTSDLLAPEPTPSVPRLPVSAQVARGAPLVRVTAMRYQRAAGIAATRDRLLALRTDDSRSMRRAVRRRWLTRAVLLLPLPAIVGYRLLAEPSWLDAVLDGWAGRVGLLLALVLGALGSVWTWLVTRPDFGVRRRPLTKGDAHAARSLYASEQLALRLAAGVTPAGAWRAVARANHFAPGSALPAAGTEEALELVARLRRTALRRRRGPLRRRVAMTALPLVTCLLPATAILVLL